MTFIELHEVRINLLPPRSTLGNNLLINIECISKIIPYKFLLPEDLSGINPNSIGDAMTEIVLTTTAPLGKESERIVIIESYDYIKTLLKQCG